MIKSGIKNYFLNLKYYFIPVGTLFVGAVIGLSILIPNAMEALSAMMGEILGIIDETHVDFNTVMNHLVSSVMSLNWAEPVSSLKTLVSSEWLNGTLSECFQLVSVELQPYSDAIAASINGAIATIKVLTGVLIFFSAIGLIGGYYLTRYLVRGQMAKRTFAKFLISLVAESIISSLIIVLCGWLFILWKPSVAISSVLGLLIYSTFSLALAYVVYGFKKISVKKVLNAKNIFLLLLSDLIVLAISLALMVILTLLSNAICGIMLGFAFVEIAFLVISMNGESYVINLLGESETETGLNLDAVTQATEQDCVPETALAELEPETAEQSKPADEI